MGVSLSSKLGLFISIVLPILAAGLINVIVVTFGLTGSSEQARAIPEGWEWVGQVVGFVWMALFGAMGAAAWLTYTSPGPRARFHGNLIVALIVACALYPFYTLGMRMIPGLIGNIAVLILTAAVIALVWRTSRAAALLVTPVAVWIVIATVYLVQVIAINTPAAT